MPKLIALVILMTVGSVVAGILLSSFVPPAVIFVLLAVACCFLVFRRTRAKNE